jgi:hypothetical protein
MKPMHECEVRRIVEGYWPNALRLLAEHCVRSNGKHNPGEPVHWAFDKSTHHAASAERHTEKFNEIDYESGKLHGVSAVWRALSRLETLCIGLGMPMGELVWCSEAEPEPEVDVEVEP